MNSFNKVYTIEELQSQGFDGEELKKATLVKYSNKTFIRASNHPKQFKDLALEEQNTYIESGLDSFVVESRFYLTIWKEEKQEGEQDISLKPPQNVARVSATVEQNSPKTEQIIPKENPPESNKQENQDVTEQTPIQAIKILNIKPKPKKYRGSDYL